MVDERILLRGSLSFSKYLWYLLTYVFVSQSIIILLFVIVPGSGMRISFLGRTALLSSVFKSNQQNTHNKFITNNLPFLFASNNSNNHTKVLRPFNTTSFLEGHSDRNKTEPIDNHNHKKDFMPIHSSSPTKRKISDMSSSSGINYALLSQQNAATSNAIIDLYSDSSEFAKLSKVEGDAILQRDREDGEKLQVGIDYAKSKGVIDPNYVPEPYVQIDVLGKTPDQVCEEILETVQKQKSDSGSVIVLCGLSGTGKVCYSILITLCCFIVALVLTHSLYFSFVTSFPLPIK